MKISQLRYFKTVCEYMSFTKASNELYVSQPAISSSIRQLEKEFNIKLFNRESNNLTLTEEGEWLLEKCDNVLIEFDSIEEDLRMLSGKIKSLKVGIPPMIGAAYFFNILNKFKEAFQDIKVDIFEAGSLKVRENVYENIIDIGVVLRNEITIDKFNVLKLCDTELVFCVDKKHYLADRKTISIKEISEIKVVLFKEDSYQNGLIKKEFKEASFKLDIMLYSSQLSSIKELLYYGNCGAFLFKEIADNDPNLVAIHLERPINLEIGLLWRKNQKLYPCMNSFINFCKKTNK